MKQEKKKSMLLLPCAVIAAVIGIMVYFACSDDEWEGSPEYLMTLAPMQTRAGVDVGGDIVMPYLWITGGSGACDSQYIDGFTGPILTMNFSWTDGIAGAINVSAQGAFTDYDSLIYKNLQANVTSTYCPAAAQHPDSTIIIYAFVNVTGSKYINYVNGHYDRIEPINIIGMDFSVDITNSTHWIWPSQNTTQQSDSVKELQDELIEQPQKSHEEE